MLSNLRTTLLKTLVSSWKKIVKLLDTGGLYTLKQILLYIQFIRFALRYRFTNKIIFYKFDETSAVNISILFTSDFVIFQIKLCSGENNLIWFPSKQSNLMISLWKLSFSLLSYFANYLCWRSLKLGCYEMLPCHPVIFVGLLPQNWQYALEYIPDSYNIW